MMSDTKKTYASVLEMIAATGKPDELSEEEWSAFLEDFQARSERNKLQAENDALRAKLEAADVIIEAMRGVGLRSFELYAQSLHDTLHPTPDQPCQTASHRNGSKTDDEK